MPIYIYNNTPQTGKCRKKKKTQAFWCHEYMC